MKLPDEMGEHSRFSPSIIMTAALVTVFVGCLLILVLFWNDNRKEMQEAKEQQQIQDHHEKVEPTVEDLSDILTGSTLSPDDLDFWEKYPDGSASPAPSEKPSQKEENKEEDPSRDGKHTLVKNDDDSEEWVLISPYLPKNDYDFTKLVCQSDLMKYYVEGKLVSFVGVDVSKLQDYIDFTKVKKAGIDFVMVRVGARGYSTGQLVMDDYFAENIKHATDAGLKVGVYFSSQAISQDEAKEEAKLVLESIKEYQITYPIAFCMSRVVGDTQRTDYLSKAERTNIAKTFMTTIEDAGYIPILYGTKQQLIKQLDLSKLTDYDTWLAQLSDVPDYPYRFSMWQYSANGSIDGIAGYSNLNISFIDYSEK